MWPSPEPPIPPRFSQLELHVKSPIAATAFAAKSHIYQGLQYRAVA
jgi:hypothetical protein